MTRYKKAAVAIGLSLLAVGAQANLVKNGSFSDGLNYWDRGTRTETVVNGEAVLLDRFYDQQYISQTLTLVANTSYLMTFKSGGAGTGWVDFYSVDIPLNGSPDAVTFSNGGQHSYNFTTGSSTTFSKLEFASVIGDITIDDVSITTAVPEPESWAMLLVGLTAVGGIARRRRAAPYQG